MPVVRTATARDVQGIAGIYAREVAEGWATFDTELPPDESWLAKLLDDRPGRHFLVAEADGRPLGFAYSTEYRPRGAYAGTVETTVYVTAEAQGQGIGRRVYSELIARLRGDGMHTALAVVAVPNPASVALHHTLGFRRAGVLTEVGRKFGRWLDVEFWQLML